MGDPITEGAKATQEVAKTTGKAIDAATGFGQWAASVFAEPIAEASGIVTDRLKFVRLERAIEYEFLVKKHMRERGMTVPTRYVTLKVLLPLIEAATLEDSDELRNLWATLLVNAADASVDVNVTRRFISILQDFEPLEATCLQKIAEQNTLGVSGYAGILTVKLPESASLFTITTGLPDGLGRCAPEVEVALWNLVRLGCLRPSDTWKNRYVDVVNLTVLGAELLKACSKPTAGPRATV